MDWLRIDRWRNHVHGFVLSCAVIVRGVVEGVGVGAGTLLGGLVKTNEQRLPLIILPRM